MGLRDQNNGKKIGINGSRIYHVTTLLSLSDRNQSSTYLVAVCPVSCCWPKFQSIFNPCNPLQQTTRNIINAKIIQDYVHPDNQTQPTFDMTPGFKPFIKYIVLNNKTEPLVLEFNWWIQSLFSPMGECIPFQTRSSFKRFLYCGSKVLSVVQSTKCVVLKWETACRFSTYVVRSFFYLDIGFFRHPLLRPAVLPFSQTYLIRIFQKPHRRYPRVLRNETAATVSVRPV